MSRTYARLALPLVLLMFMAGCIYSSTPEWGTGDGEVHVEIDDEDKTATIKSQLGNGFDKTVTLQCDAKEFTITGMIISSQIYDSHPDIEEGDIDSAMGASVIIHKMSWSQAEGVEEGSAERVKIKEWTSPLDPVEDGGLSKVDENSEDWEVIGVIPGSENIADGLNVLEHWHQPIKISGYMVPVDQAGTIGPGPDCELEEQGHGMIVTKIKTEEGVVSMDGEDDDEYSLGDTDLFGGWTFILFFLIVGVGGGIGLFMVSTMVIRQGARATAEALLGREGFAKAIQMKKDVKSSKKAGLESASDRAAKQRASTPPPKKEKREEVEISGFNLDSVLSASGNDDEGPSKFGGGGSVVVTNEAKQIQSQPVVTSAPVKIDNTPMPSSNVTSSRPEPEKRGHFSASMSSSRISSKPSSEKPVNKPVKRRAVKKRAAKSAPEPEPEVQERRASVSDDEEFSDFSF